MSIRNIILAVIIITAIILAGCGGGGGGGQGTNLTGTVIDGATNEPLSGVRVAIGTASTVTKSDGTFTLTGIVTGSAILTAQLDNYEISTVAITINPGSNTLPEPIRMAPLTGNPPDITPRTLQGTITLTGTSNASGVVVTLLSGTTIYDQMTTTSDGKYSFWAPAGTYKLRATKTGFVTKEQQVKITDLTKVVTVNITLVK